MNVNIWKSISVDRSLGRSYIQDLDGYKSKYTTKNQILSVSIKKLKFIEKTISNFKVDVCSGQQWLLPMNLLYLIRYAAITK